MLNSPYELLPKQKATKGVLLVHGLGDSPYSFIDISRTLQEQGFLVRTILLPGHGSKPADLMLPTLSDWQSIVSYHTELMANEVDELWLGGYSTGGNLVTSEAYRNDKVAGLLLFSPAFQATSDAVKYTPIANWFIDWVDVDPETNITRYESLPTNGAAVYYQTSEIVREDLNKPFNKPVLMVLSEADSVVDSQTIAGYFTQSFTHPNSLLIWYGDNPPQDKRTISYTMKLPQYRISAGSHMGPLFSPNNPRYGQFGNTRICNNGQSEEKEALCYQGTKPWFSGWGYQAANNEANNNVYARLTWNPYYDELVAQMTKLIRSTTVSLSSIASK
ncbi:alpha/beta hydrolase [Spartinivicinus poritis]|uniref:Alpha/beta fold hydrolase n=1 Tax=Spartinivicinus poritis TaxID=2994640 RepID=A0ABT5UIJ4_9GAMM|nr:alpha/beta fold hydrolase [Spartinivicinus sp. A2-2]MDE1465342.1 alpha/beta fold hydrolase [Spartinivicinus sp. A2-2]